MLGKIEAYLKIYYYIVNADVRELCVVSATANRGFVKAVMNEQTIKLYANGDWIYKLL